MNRPTIGAVLRGLMASRNIHSAGELARRSGVSQPTISRILNGKTVDPERDTADTLAAFFRVSVPQLVGDLPIIETGDAVGSNYHPVEIKGTVPVISWVQAGNWSEVFDQFQPGDADEWLPCPVNHGPHTFVVRVRGDSMHNPHGDRSFKEGDLLFVDPDRVAQHRSLVIVRLDNAKEATFKQLIIDGDRKFLKALNPGWPDPIIEIADDATIVGVVIFRGEEL